MSDETPESREGQAPTSHAAVHVHAHQSPVQFQFLEQLKHRNVIRVGILYLVVCWLILDPIHVLFHMLDVPVWANRLVVILMAVVFPAVLLFAWVYEITPEGLRRTLDVEPHKSVRLLTGRRLDRAIMVVMALAIAYFVADKFWLSKHVPAPTSPPASAQVATVASPATPPTATVDKSIAVLPFVDMSERKDQEYFSDGLSEELIDRLTHAADLRVISRTSSFYFKGKQATIADIAKTLGVSHVLEGSVRKAGRELRITAQLVRASDGAHLWSQTYDRNLADIFKVQDEIAGTVAQALKVALRSGTTGRTEASQEAYSLVLKGNYFFNRGTDADIDKALELYTQATRLDPNYALAWAKVGRATSKNSTEGLAKALEALQRSLRIDPNLAYAHYVLGRTQGYVEWDWAAAKAELERAIELDPDDLLPRADLAYLTEGIFGQFDRKVRYLRQIVSTDPLDAVSLDHLGYSLYLAGRFDEAVAAYRKLLQLNPAAPAVHSMYGVVLLLAHQPRQALAAIEEETDEASRLWGLAMLDWEIGKRVESDAAVSRLERKYASNVGAIAQVRAYRGEVDAAFKWLDRAYQRDRFFMALMPVDPLLGNLHNDSRFGSMLAKLKLDDWKRQVFASGP
jgi:adenylate cyclase